MGAGGSNGSSSAAVVGGHLVSLLNVLAPLLVQCCVQLLQFPLRSPLRSLDARLLSELSESDDTRVTHGFLCMFHENPLKYDEM